MNFTITQEISFNYAITANSEVPNQLMILTTKREVEQKVVAELFFSDFMNLLIILIAPRQREKEIGPIIEVGCEYYINYSSRQWISESQNSVITVTSRET